jgi:N12 class adenine-specific DNA methylase
MPTDLLDDVINAAPPAAAARRDPLDQMLDDVPDAPKQASGDLAPPTPVPGSNPLHMPLAPVPIPSALAGPPVPADASTELPVAGMAGVPLPMPRPQDWKQYPGVPSIIQGAHQVAQGLKEPIATGPNGEPAIMGTYGVPLPAPPMNPNIAGGASNVVRGGMAVAAPVALPLTLAEAPVAGALAIGTSLLAQQGTEYGLKALGVRPEYAALASDVAGLIPYTALGARGLDSFLSTRARTAAESAESWQRIGDLRERVQNGRDLAESLFPKPIPIKLNLVTSQGTVPVDARVELNGVGGSQLTAGRPAFRVVDENTGKTLYSGWGRDVQNWLHSNGAQPKAPLPETPPTAETQPAAVQQAQPTGSPAEPPAPPKPADVERVSPATPNAPTAAVPTAPESPETINLQLQQLGAGQRKVVMFPKGTPAPAAYPPGTAITSDAFGNTYAFRPDLIKRADIKKAAKNNTLHEILGSSAMGMGAVDKSQLPPDAPAVTAQAADGTEVQSTATDEASLPATIEATQQVTPPGGTVSIKPAEQVIGERQGQPTPPPAPPLPSQTGLDQAGGDMAAAITGNMYDMLWGKVQAGDVTESGAPSALLQAAKLVRDRGGLQTPEDFRVFAQEYAQIPRDQNFQKAMRDFVARYVPAPQTDLASVIDAAPPTTVSGSPGEPVAVTRPEQAAPEKIQAPTPIEKEPEQPGAAAPRRSYQEVQDAIDKREDELFDPSNPRKLLFHPRDLDGDSIMHDTRHDMVRSGQADVMPADLADLYDERDAIQKHEDEEFDRAIDQRLAPVVPDEAQRRALVTEITQTDRIPGLRITKGTDTIYNVGRIANAILKHVAQHVTHEPEDHWEEVDAILAGTPDNPSIQLRRKTGPRGYDPYTEPTYTAAQKILDALMEGNAPQYPRRELKTQKEPAEREPEKLEAPKPIGKAPEQTQAAPTEREPEKIEAPAPIEKEAELQTADDELHKRIFDELWKPWSSKVRAEAYLEGLDPEREDYHEEQSRVRGEIERLGEEFDYILDQARKTLGSHSEADEIAEQVKWKTVYLEDDDHPREGLHPEQFKTWNEFRDSVAIGDTVYVEVGSGRPLKGTIRDFQDWDKTVEVKLDPASLPGHAPIKEVLESDVAAQLGSSVSVTAPWEMVSTHAPAVVDIKAEPDLAPPKQIGEPEAIEKPTEEAAEPSSEWESQEKFVNPRTGKEVTIEKSTKTGKYSFVLENGARSVYGTKLPEVRAKVRDLLGLPDGARPQPIAAPAAASTTKDLKIGDLVRYQGKIYEVGYRGGGDKIRLQDPVTHEGSLTVFAGQPGLERVSREEADLAAPAEVGKPTAAPTKSYKYELKIQGEGDKWHPNQVAFATREEAESAGVSKFQNWMMADAYRVVESDETPNYRWDKEQGLVSLEKAPAPAQDLAAPQPIGKPETIEPHGPRGESEGGSRDERVRDESPGSLEGVPSEDVRRPGEDEQALPVSVGGSGEHAGSDAGAPVREGEDAVRPGAGDRVPGVVSPSERGGSTQLDVQSEPTPTSNLSGDFRLTPEEAAAIETRGAKTRARANIEAIRIIKQIIAEGNRAATLEEQQKIAAFVGWGMSEIAQGLFTGYKSEWAGLREELNDLLTKEERDTAEESTQNAHYTRRDIAAAMWDTAKRLGLKPGASILEPGMGIGNFFMMMPEDLMAGTSRTGVELDLLTGAMAKALFPGSNILVKPYQQTNLPNDWFDFAIGNVPFARHPVVDPAFKRQPALTANVHNYFFAKTMEKLRPGGVMLAITSRYTMDGQNTAFRKWMDDQAELLGAIRLPRETFSENAGTTVTVDLLAFRKRIPGEIPLTNNAWIQSPNFQLEDGSKMNLNEYFQAHPEMMMGEMRPGSMKFRGDPELFGEFTMDKLRDLLNTLPANALTSWHVSEAGTPGAMVEEYPEAAHIKNQQYGIVNGAVVQRQGGVFKPVTLSGKKLERMKSLIALRGAMREVIRTQRLDEPEEQILAAREALNKEYDKFIKQHGPVNQMGNAQVFADDPDWAPLSGSLEDYDREAYLKNTPKDAKTKGTWSVKGNDVVLTHGKQQYVIAKKRAIFRVRTIQKPERIEHVETAAEALAVSLNELGRMDWDRMQELTGRDPKTLQKELIGRIFRNPTSNRWETEDEYLSGNVRQKLKDAQFIAKKKPQFQVNVEALEKVLPTWKPSPVSASGSGPTIKAGLGATWIPDTDYSRFAGEVLKVERALGSPNDPHSRNVIYVPQTGAFVANESPNFFDHGAANTTEFGTAYFNGMQLFQMALNGKSPVARDTFTDMDGNEYSVKNADETIKAVEKQTKLKDEFQKWVWSDDSRAQRLETKYNEELNNLRLREHDGSHLTFPGLNKSWLRSGEPEPHQKNAVWRTIQSGNTLYAHVVGAGKTLEMIMAAMELRRLGMRKKPMVMVPNHLVEQWRDDWMRAYPGAQILVPTKKDFTKKNRQRLMARIASGNYDGVIVGHKSFEKIPVNIETFKAFIEEETKEIRDAIESARAGIKDEKDEFKNPTIKNLRRRLATLEAKLEKRLKAEEKDTGLTFEELGVDQLFVDEADLFKNLGFMTMMDRMAGLPNTDSDRATDLLLKSRFIGNLHGGDKGTVFATGTPVSNSIAEVWTMMRYLMPSYLKREGFDTFDSWAKTFGQTRTAMEVAPEGGRFIQRTRFSKFQNAAQMMNMFRIVADIRTAKQLNLPTPAIYKGGYVDIVAPASDELKAFVGVEIADRADAVRSGAVKPEEDNMLKISSDGRKASLDMRLIDPRLPDNPESKPNLAVKQILEVYKEFDEHKGTQLVFLDLGTPKSDKVTRKKATPASDQVANVDEAEAEPEEETSLYNEDGEEEEEEEVETGDESRERSSVYADIKRKLVAGGIPAEEIAFIQEAKTDAQKKKLFDQVNEGRVRVLLGSTEKMGAGMNVQQRLVALHHLDAPWRPRDMQQRDGRIVRQGNWLYRDGLIKSVRLYRYMTEGSFDAFMWETLASKAAPIEQLMEGDPNLDEIDELSPLVLSYEQAKAISSGNPDIREKIILDQDIHKLEVMRGGWMSEQAHIHKELGTLPPQIRAIKQKINEYESDIETRDANTNYVVEGKSYPLGSTGAGALIDLLKTMGTPGSTVPVNATYRGFRLEASPDTYHIEARTAKGRGAKTYVRERTPDGKFLYYQATKVQDTVSQSQGQRSDLGLEPLKEAEAQDVHADWDKTRGEAKDIPWRSSRSLSVYGRPNLRLITKSGNYLGAVDYKAPSKALDTTLAYHVDNFDSSTRWNRDELRRFEKKFTEMESKAGDGFQHEEKLQTMKRRQAELAAKLGETSDDQAALRAEEENQRSTTSALRPFLQDPKAALHAEWFPQRRWFGTSSTGGKYTIKGYAITPELGVTKHKPARRGGSPTFSVEHILSGASVKSNFRTDWQAVDYARKIAKAISWDFTKPPSDIGAKIAEFNRSWEPPTETPEQSKQRLADTGALTEADEFYVTRAEGEGEQAPEGYQKPLTRRSEGEGSVYLGSGLGALQPYLEKFGREDIVPALKSASRKFTGVADDMQRLFAPQTRGVQARETAGNVRELMGEMAQKDARAHAALEAYKKALYKLPKEHGVHGFEVIDAIEGGDYRKLPPDLQQFAKTVRQLFDDRKELLEKLGLVKTFVENYFTHMYKDPKQAEAWTANWMARRPMAGKESFRKQRTYPTLREAVEDPDFTLVPKFDNPVDYVYAGLAQMDKSIAAHEMFEELREKGYLKFSRKLPGPGWSAIDDKLFTVYGPRRGAVKFDIREPDRSRFEDDEEYENALHAWEERMETIDENISPRDVVVFGRREMGRYYAPDQVAQVINNYLSAGLRGKTAFDAWMALKGGMNMLNLSFSAFHVLTTTLNSSLSDLALGVNQLFAGRPLKAAASAGRFLVPLRSVIEDTLRGNRLGQVFNGTAKNPTAIELAITDALRQAGGRFQQSSDAKPLLDGLKKAWAQNNLIGVGLRAANPLLWAESTMRPIMQGLVPRVKLGAFAKAVQFEMEQHPDMSVEEARDRFGKVLDSMDNRFGQLNQSNMLMNNLSRDVMNAIVGRPGWTLGTIRELVGGSTDVLRNLAEIASGGKGGKKPELSHRTAYVIALLLGGAVINAVTTFLLTGTMPKGMDYIAPRDGGLTEDGHPSRIVLPLYLSKDVYSWATRPVQTLKAKLAQILMVAADLATNRAFGNHKIYGRGGEGIDKYLEGLFFPYAVSGAQKNFERGAGWKRTLLPFLGIMPAGRDVGLSKAEKILQQYQEEQRANVAPVPTDRTRAKNQVLLAAEHHNLAEARRIGQQAIQAGNLTRSDVNQLLTRAKNPTIVSDIKRTADLGVVLEAYDAATPQEKALIKREVQQKVMAARGKPYKWDADSQKLAQKYFGVRPIVRPSFSDFAAPAALQ